MKKLVLLSLLFAQAALGQTTFNSSGTWLCPAGVTCVTVEVWGAGGGGAGNSQNTDGGGGGGGGGYSQITMTVVPGTNYTVTVGTGGIGGVGDVNGLPGGSSWFNTAATVFANGGAGGTSPLFNGMNGGPGGAGGAAGIGSFAFAGGAGGNGRNANNGTGGGGGSTAGTTAVGTAGNNGGVGGGTGGVGPNGVGNGGNGGATDANGTAGTVPGSGGGGAGDNNGVVARSGASGTNGRVVITPGIGNCTTAFQPGVGIAGEYVGACEVSSCSGTFYDNGGPTANYPNDINAIYRVFCPDVAGNCMTLTFNSFNTEATYDYLTIGNGPTQNSTVFTTAPANAAGQISGTPAVPFSYTSSHASGCLTTRFTSDFITNSTGWSAVLSCTPCAGGPNGTDNNDCIRMTPLCSNAAVGGNSSGPGIVSEACTGVICPAGGENHSNWFTFQVATSGTLDVTITPSTATDDYDYAIYGPNVSCSALGSPLRCSDSGGTGVTGTSSGAADVTESVTGDKFTSTLNVIAGQTYIMMVDEWTPTGAGYGLSFGGTATLDCSVLPIELSEFGATYVKENKGVDIYWKTETERNNDYFVLEKSIDGVNYKELTKVDGAGNSFLPTQYYVFDPEIFYGVSYYRLKQVDFDGNFSYSKVETVNILDDKYNVLTVFPNPTTGTTEFVFNSYYNQEITLEITNLNGTSVFSKSLAPKKGSIHEEVDLNFLDKGLYIVTIRTGDKIYTEKLVKE